jgi:hypothetical protein
VGGDRVTSVLKRKKTVMSMYAQAYTVGNTGANVFGVKQALLMLQGIALDAFVLHCPYTYSYERTIRITRSLIFSSKKSVVNARTR